MNAFIIKINNYLVAHKTRSLSALVFINLLLFVIIQTQQSNYFGSIDRTTSIWSTYSKQHQDKLETIITTIDFEKGHAQEMSVFHNFTFEKIGKNEYIAHNPEANIKFYRHRVYSLDDKCFLSFRGTKSMKIENASLRCKY
ncbi:hypothetical protein BIY22_16390 [Vibrio panuliri]|uniref:Uncharacterized protein n=1 Tax=Vibrio panuliri TaxID=1381081 RepID=A0A1Q9HMV6_9VIBR|nr:hypothetical protein BIY22_16390 [Vibrio panuliri]